MQTSFDNLSGSTKLLVGGLLILGSLLLAFLMAQNLDEFLLAGLLLIPFWIIALHNWKWAIYGLVIYLPFAGLPTVWFNQFSSYTVLLKDFLFVLPAYLGFLLNYRTRKEPTIFAGAFTALMSIFTAVVVVQMFNPELNNLLVGVIGLKVWVMYMPMYFIGYHLIKSKEELFSFFKLIVFAGLPSMLFGIIQAVLIYTGYSDWAYAIYGDMAISVTQSFFAATLETGQSLSRVPSTFTFAAQFGFFLDAMFPIIFILWLKESGASKQSGRYLAILGILILAALLSGARAAFILFPVFILIATIMTGTLQTIWKPALGVAVGLGAVGTLLGTRIDSLYSIIGDMAGDYLFVTQTNEFARALDATTFGLGTGTSTGPARYVMVDATTFGSENLYGKVFYELGVIGLIVLVLLFLRLIWDNYQIRRRLQDPDLFQVAGIFFAFFIVLIVYFWKGSILDYDPLNVYFWLYAGIMMKLVVLDSSSKNKPQLDLRG